MKCLFIILIFTLSFTLANAQSLTFDVLSYDAQIEPDFSNKSVKGKVVINLKSLKNDLAEEKLWQELKDYTQKYWEKSVVTKDFQNSFEKSSGKDLSEFFKKWVY